MRFKVKSSRLMPISRLKCGFKLKIFPNWEGGKMWQHILKMYKHWKN